MSYKKLKTLPEWKFGIFKDDNDTVHDKPIWSGRNPPPAIGDTVLVTFNALGTGRVVGYFIQLGWLGVLVQFNAPPEWYTRQHKGNPPGHVFGAEVRTPTDLRKKAQ